MATRDISVICFDLGGVLLRICRSWEEGCRAAGVEIRGMEQRPRTADMRREIVVQYQKGLIDCDTFACAIADTLGSIYTPDEIMAVHQAWVLEEYPGVDRLVDDVHEAGLTTACLSNTNRGHWSLLPEWPTVQKLQMRLASHHLGLHKPDPEIYHEARRRLECEAGEILFFDDLEENVIGARAAGWAAEHIDHAGDPAAQMRALIEERGLDLEAVTRR